MIRKVQIAFIGFCIGILPFAYLDFAHSESLNSKNGSIQLTGVNISGAEFGADNIPGQHAQHYIYPEAPTIDYFAAKGMNIIRLPVLWERLQRPILAGLDETEMQLIDTVVNYATAKKLRVVIDVHNYAHYDKVAIGARSVPAFALGNLWRQIATRYKDNDLVVFGLMNEPTGLPTETWLEAANIAIVDIRRTGAKNLILVPGNGWSSARDWLSAKYGTPNGNAMLKVVDPIKNMMFEVHQYFDKDFTGTDGQCQSNEIGVVSLTEFTKWARKNRKHGFLGEFGAGPNPTCLEALDRVLRFMAENNDVWLGWTYWAAGAWWAKDYYTNIEPLDGQDRPQMPVLEKYTRYGRSVQEPPK